MVKRRFFVLGYAHLPASRTFSSCAFTQKALNLSKMLCDLGHKVYYFGARGEESEPTIEEYIDSENFNFIATHTLEDIRNDWGDGNNLPETNGIGYEWRGTQFRNDFNKEKKPSTKKFYQFCINYINKNKKDDDFLLVMQGFYHKPIADAVNLYMTCEPGIGYRGSYAKFRAFESLWLQHFTYGSEHPRADLNGHYYDRVIPNYFVAENFEFSDKKQDYYLYIGRMIQRKGVMTAVKTTEAIGAKLVLAGQADPEIDLTKLPKNCQYVGTVDFEKRKRLMSKAIATFVPTIYLEPFAGTHIESMLSGTPPITTNFGVFPGTIPDSENGKVGFRCNTLHDFVLAANAAKEVNHFHVRKYGERFLIDNVKFEFQRWFEDIYQLYLSTKNTKTKGWHYLPGID